MTLPTDFPDRLRKAGATVDVIHDWETRRRPGSFNPVGMLNHHTGASAKGWSLAKERAYAVWMFTVGRSDLPAPLVQTAIGRSGVIYVGAAGRSNHAGTARSSGSVGSGDGNAMYYGCEWMLSGFEDIPAEMTRAGLILNAVVTETVTDTSVQTISCHYNTSVTGKWDIGDPNGVPYNGHMVLDVPKFRKAVEATRARLYHPVPSIPNVPVPTAPHWDALVAHMSCQFSDTKAMWNHDAEAVFSRGYDWITGTEAGEDYNYAVLQAVAVKHGYRIVKFRSNWIAVDKAIIKKGSFKTGYKLVAKAADVAGPGHDTAYVYVTFKHVLKGVGTIGVIGTHAPTHGREDGTPAYRVNVKWTKMIGRAVADKMRVLGKGPDLVFMGGDTNQIDKTTDVFHTPKGRKPIAVTCWDEAKKWPDTGHGNIDVIARLIRDARVTLVGCRVYRDSDLFLYSDHLLTQAKYRITLTK